MAIYERFEIDQGSDIIIMLELAEDDGTPKDLTYYKVKSKMKKSYYSDSSETIDFHIAKSDPPTDGYFVLALTHDQTDTLENSVNYIYDIELHYQYDSNSPIIVERVLEGHIKTKFAATR